MIHFLPSFILEEDKGVSNLFLELGIKDFHHAIDLVWHIPYGRNTDRADYTLVIQEQCGTCSTKHALLSKLAQEHDQEIQLVTGIYEMNEFNTPGIGHVLNKYGLDFLPEAHCYLSFGGKRFDFTRHLADTEPLIDSFLYEETIQPEQIGEYKLKLHQDFIKKWVIKKDSELSWEFVWRIREECIKALSINENTD